MEVQTSTPTHTATRAGAKTIKTGLRLGPHHFRHLRAVADGVNYMVSAKLYLAIDHGHEAKKIHQNIIDSARAIARKHDERAWRLIGLTIDTTKNAKSLPTLDQFVEARNLDGWLESEILEMYREAYPEDQGQKRKDARRDRLRKLQLELLHRLQAVAVDNPLPTDRIDSWFDSLTSEKMLKAGMLTLGEAAQRIAVGGHWYAAMKGVGAQKAQRIGRHIESLLGTSSHSKLPAFSLEAPAALNIVSVPTGGAPERPGSPSLLPPSRPLAEADDKDAIARWIKARANAPATVKAYTCESRRLLLWLHIERGGLRLCQMTDIDCTDYLAFLKNIPPQWISRRRAAPGQDGWAPFRGQLSHASLQHSLTLVTSLFAWLHAAKLVYENPWPLINTSLGDDRTKPQLDTKALSETAMRQILAYIEAQAPSPSRSRILFILRFLEAVGLRSAELLAAQVGHIRMVDEGYLMSVHGKGAKNRDVFLPGQAIDALQTYLAERGLPGIEHSPPKTPLVASTQDPQAPIGYQALYEHVKKWLARGIASSALPCAERLRLYGASAHWLRHTFGTRAVARNVPLDVVQAQLGHASINTTARTYARAPIERRASELRKAFG